MHSVKMVIIQTCFLLGQCVFKMIKMILWFWLVLPVSKFWESMFGFEGKGLISELNFNQKQSMNFCFPEESWICWEVWFSFILHRRVNGKVFISRSLESWNEGINHLECFKRNYKIIKKSTYSWVVKDISKHYNKISMIYW